MKSLAASLLVAIAAAALPAPAAAHSLVRPNQATVRYISADATSLNTLTVRMSGSRIEFRDPTVDGGIDPGSCTPGETTNDANAWIIQAFCPAEGVATVQLELGEREDTATVDLPFGARVLGGPGADKLTAGAAADALDGGDGDDRLAGGAGPDDVTGGLGADQIDGGDGDDVIATRDGLADTVRCGTGADRVHADTVDELAADCETVERQFVATPPGAASANDRVAPRLRVAAAALQHVGRRRTVRVAAVSTEAGFVAASGFVDIAGLRLPIRTKRARIAVAGGGAEVVVRLTVLQWRQTRAALRRHRRVVVRLGVVATDTAGNSREATAPAIRLQR